jgi:chemotaxis family two-component system response regulator PixG
MITKDQQNWTRQPVNRKQQITDGTYLTIEELLTEISSSSQQQFTGRLTLDTPQQEQWRFYFGMGRLLWASGGAHPRRRWRRQLALACEQDNLTKSHYTEGHLREGDHYECWDFHLLLVLHKRKILTAEQVKTTIAGVVSEILFDLNQQGAGLCTSEEVYPNEPNYSGKQVFTREWESGKRPSQQMVIPPSWGVETDAYLQGAKQRWQQWREAGLTNVSPDQAPLLLRLNELKQKISPGVYQNLVRLVTGDTTLRDLSVLMKMEPIRIARSLLPYVRQDLIALETVADLAPSTSPPEMSHGKEQLKRRSEDHSQQGESYPSTPSSQRPLAGLKQENEIKCAKLFV